MTTKNYTVILKRSNDVVSGNTKAPTSDDLQYGEIALNYHNGMEKLYMKNDIDDIVPFASEEEIERKIEITHITWNNLKSLRDNNELQPGKWYRIIDYNTTTTQEDTQSAGHQFDVLVFATDTNKLSEEARAIIHSGDTYFTNAGANLEGWKIWYCLDNDTNRFAWADTGATGRGVIYRMIDEWGNDCPYDFKNIQFKRYEITACTSSPDLEGLYGISNGQGYTTDTDNPYWVYTFSMINLFDDAIDDVSIWQNKYPSDEGYAYKQYGNIFKPYYDSYYNEDDDETLQICYLPNNVFVTNTDICAIEEDYSHGEFYGFYSNTFGNGCNSNTFGNDFGYNTFGNYCYYNSFGNSCIYNTFGNDCYYNTFGNYCTYNTFGNDCYHNTFGNGCNSNTFGNYCTYNTFGNDCRYIRVQKDYVYFIIVENGNQYIDITSSQTTSSSNILRNFTISQGVNNTFTGKTISHNSVNDTFKTTYQSSNSTVVNV